LAGIDRCLYSGRPVDAIAIKISVCVYRDVAKMNTDAKIMGATSLD